MFDHKDIHKGTWKSPDGTTVNQIDHVLVDSRHGSNIEDVRTYRGADCDSDHFLLLIKIKAKIRIQRSGGSEGIVNLDTERLKDTDIRKSFQLELKNRFQELDNTEDINKMWVETKGIMEEVGLKVLGRKKRTQNRKWWNTACEQAYEERRKYKILMEQDEGWKDKHRVARNRLRNLMKHAKREHLDNILQEVETLSKGSQSRKFYKEIKLFRKAFKPSSQLLENENGMLLSNPDDIKEEWKQYFKTLLNCPVAGSPITEVIENNDTLINEISPIEVRKAISRLKNNKAPGADGIPGELWKYGEDITTSKMYELITKIWKEEKQPDEWNLGVICPVHKKGSRRKCSNYRGIAILPTAYKVLSYIILGRLEPYNLGRLSMRLSKKPQHNRPNLSLETDYGEKVGVCTEPSHPICGLYQSI
ncbi:unnamed protein product [Colias eurytheme]|nr:unnamed protein product [Colias eurytheme]